MTFTQKNKKRRENTMKKLNWTKVILITGAIVSLGAVSVVTGSKASASTVISETSQEKVISFSKDDLKDATGIKLDKSTVTEVYDLLTQADVWEKVEYSSAEAKRIASRFNKSQYQAMGILKDMAADEGVSLKVVTINKPYFKTVNIGTLSEELTFDTEDSAVEVNEDTALKETIKEIDIEIEYKNKDIEIDYEVKSNGRVKAKYENEWTGEKLESTKAEKKINALFEGLDVKNSRKSAIKEHVLDELNAPQNCKKFDFKVKFTDTSKVDFKLK